MIDKKTSTVEKILAGAFAALLVLVIGLPLALLRGFILMIAIGAVHGWVSPVPTIGYWSSVLVAWGAAVIFDHSGGKK